MDDDGPTKPPTFRRPCFLSRLSPDINCPKRRALPMQQSPARCENSYVGGKRERDSLISGLPCGLIRVGSVKYFQVIRRRSLHKESADRSERRESASERTKVRAKFSHAGKRGRQHCWPWRCKEGENRTHFSPTNARRRLSLSPSFLCLALQRGPSFFSLRSHLLL